MWELCWKKCYTQYTYGHKHMPTYGCDLPTYLCWPLPEATSTEQTQPCRGARSYSFPFGSNYLCALYSQRTCHFLPISGGSCSWKTSTNPLWSCESEETQQCYFDLTHKQKMKTTKSRAMIYHASLSIVISEINRNKISRFEIGISNILCFASFDAFQMKEQKYFLMQKYGRLS